MKRFFCTCGQEIFFENTHCNRCGSLLGFDPESLELHAIEALPDSRARTISGKTYRRCAHHQHDMQCNWLMADDESQIQCISCRMTRVIPDQNLLRNVRRWSVLESSKKRMLHGVLSLGLPVQQRNGQPLEFRFLEDKWSNPEVQDEQVLSGHLNGVITLNAAEADSSYREATREAMNEPYRTLLGHFRHEMGHFYWDRLIANSPSHAAFRKLFGDETTDYQAALQHYYQHGPRPDWQEFFISAYASAHPLEDWAETWAHYLLMQETLQTAVSFDMITHPENETDFQEWLSEWSQLVVVLNALNRSIGNADAYPFVISKPVQRKLHLIHQLIHSNNR
ncbi:hypothetical protein MPL1_11188 [Methylophaga lonarensis MPL]|uniref:Zinc-ribbon domain-containing protein n=1 Tax=Methylophaga lonarensis MPL TaxID=1286106 RepID=M7PEH5_9GAMM|nr:putative zinc-binding metallopeptidase [Methylophaga lonarensis]EMR12275.1 hypothetical protein MPL1_11188 [Methylophaga lonarensis MPL]